MLLQLQNVKKGFREPDGRWLPILNVQRFSWIEPSRWCWWGRAVWEDHAAACDRRDQPRRFGTDSHRWRRHRPVVRSGSGSFSRRPDRLHFPDIQLTAWLFRSGKRHVGYDFCARTQGPKPCRRLIERVGLTMRATHKPAALSVGEQQRVAVARALANRPSLILADEPTANVDRANQQHIVELIRETCREERVALILVTHSSEVSEQFDRVDRLESINQPDLAESPVRR
jgi:ABC-type molybdenum transport system ATPase subunit/photorepair protein PhrA